jgi:AhpD family alkylhydroperoxidase
MMTITRISLGVWAPAISRVIAALGARADFAPRLRELVRIRASQLNGCAYWVDLHSVDAQRAGEGHRRIFALAA